MADSRHTFEIVQTLKDEASEKMKRTGDVGAQAGQKIEGGMKRADAATEQTGRSFLELGEKGKKAAAVAGTAFASVGAGVSLATASVDSLAGAAATAAGSIAAGFGSGGVVGGAIAIASAAVGGLINVFRQAGIRAEERAKQAAEAWKRVAAELDKTTKAAETLGSSFDKIIEDAEFQRWLDRMNRAFDGFDEAGAKAERQWLGVQASIRAAIQEAESARSRALRVLDNPDLPEADRLAARKAIAQADAEIVNLRQDLARAERELTTILDEQHRIRLDDIKAQGEAAALAREQARIEADKAALAERYTQEVERSRAANEDEAAILAEKAALVAKIQASEKAHAAQIEARRQREASLNQSLDRRLQLLRAETDEQRERLRIMHEAQDLIESGADAEKVKLLTAEQLTQLAEREAAARAAEAELSERTANAAERKVRASREDLDITKRFASVPGTGGIFGFGAGRVGRNTFGEPASTSSRSRSAGADVGPLPDPRPDIKAVGAGIARIPEFFSRVVDALASVRAEATRAVDRVAELSIRAISDVRREVADLRAIVRSMETRLARSGAVGGP